ncbi:MAG: hypothetical protein O3B85_03445 [Planctomycetota bacterium]|nr:hypothetical protein [Planctomycetota bacterium]
MDRIRALLGTPRTPVEPVDVLRDERAPVTERVLELDDREVRGVRPDLRDVLEALEKRQTRWGSRAKVEARARSIARKPWPSALVQ